MEIEVISCFLILLQKRKNLPVGADLSLNHIGIRAHKFFSVALRALCSEFSFEFLPRMHEDMPVQDRNILNHIDTVGHISFSLWWAFLIFATNTQKPCYRTLSDTLSLPKCLSKCVEMISR